MDFFLFLLYQSSLSLETHLWLLDSPLFQYFSAISIIISSFFNPSITDAICTLLLPAFTAFMCCTPLADLAARFEPRTHRSLAALSTKSPISKSVIL